MKTGDVVRVYPDGQPSAAAFGSLQLISTNGLSAAIVFPDLPSWMHPTETDSGVFVSDEGAHLLATRMMYSAHWFNIARPQGPALIIEAIVTTDPDPLHPPGYGRCRFYAHAKIHGHLIPNPGSNQCALVTNGHAPCKMEIQGQEPDETRCEFLAETLVDRILDGPPPV